jgi:hypothetical protein
MNERKIGEGARLSQRIRRMEMNFSMGRNET